MDPPPPLPRDASQSGMTGVALFTEALMNTMAAAGLGGAAGAMVGATRDSRRAALAAVRRAIKVDARARRDLAETGKDRNVKISGTHLRSVKQRNQVSSSEFQKNTRDATRLMARAAARAQEGERSGLFATLEARGKVPWLAGAQAEMRDMMPTWESRKMVGSAGPSLSGPALRDALRRVAAETAGRVVGRVALRYGIVSALFVGTFSSADAAIAVVLRDLSNHSPETPPADYRYRRTAVSSIAAGGLTGGIFGRRILSGGVVGVGSGFLLGALGAGVFAAIRAMHSNLDVMLQEARHGPVGVATPKASSITDELREELALANDISEIAERGRQPATSSPDATSRR